MRAKALLYVWPALALIPMGPSVFFGAKTPDDFNSYNANVLGGASLIAFLATLTITPLVTVTGSRKYVALRRVYGLWAFVLGFVAFVAAAIIGPDPDGVTGRIAGHAALLTGTLLIALLLPLGLTGNRRAQLILGRSWRKFQKPMTYLVWAVMVLHIWTLGGRTPVFIATVDASLPLLFLRVPSIARAWVRVRKARGKRAWLLWAVGFVLAASFCFGMGNLLLEEARQSMHAFTLSPPD